MPPKRGLNLANTKRSTYKRQKKCNNMTQVWDTPLYHDNSDTDTADECVSLDPKPHEVQENITYEHNSNVEVLTATACCEHPTQIEVLIPSVDKSCQTDSSATSDDAEKEQYRVIEEWLREAGEQKFMVNLKTAITNGTLKPTNICFKLFSELLRNLCSTRTVYTPETLLWWVTGLKMYGSGWLRLMKGTPEKPNFSVPCQTTLKSLCPRAIRLQGPRFH